MAEHENRAEVGLSEAHREALTDALASSDSGCWDHESCCWASAEAMFPAVDRIIAEEKRKAAERALREAADFFEPVIGQALGAVKNDFGDGWRQASALMLDELRDRADRIAGDA